MDTTEGWPCVIVPSIAETAPVLFNINWINVRCSGSASRGGL